MISITKELLLAINEAIYESNRSGSELAQAVIEATHRATVLNRLILSALKISLDARPDPARGFVDETEAQG